jgi:hypothetical protein
MADFQTGGMWGETNTSTQTTTGEAGKAKANVMAASPTYAKAVGKTQKAEGKVAAAKKKKADAQAKPEYQDAKKKADESKKAYDDNQNAQVKKENEISTAETKAETTNTEYEAANAEATAYVERIEELKKDGSPEALAAAEKLQNDTSVMDKLSAAADKKLAADNDLKKKEKELKALEDAEDGLEDTMNADKKAFDEEEKKIEEIDEEIKDAEDDLDDAIVEENKTLDKVAEEYPETVGVEAEKFKKAIAADKQKADQIAQEKAQAEQDAEDMKSWDEQYDKNEEAVENYGTDADGLSLSNYYDDDAAFDCKDKTCLNELMKKAKIKMEVDRIKQLENALQYAQSPEEAAEIQARLEAAKSISGVEQALNGGLAASFFPGSKVKAVDGKVIWDSPTHGVDMAGRLDKLIAEHMQPKYKHAYLGEFPGKLSKLDWMVKSMDRPKIDVEYVEQIRNNVKRYYPIKYNYGDISFTFWDNTQHKTINTIHEYFTGKVWQHFSVSGSGFMLLRDSTVIPLLVIWDLSVDGEDNLKYCFENVSLASFDFDANEDETDEGVHTIQCVFKFERYNVTATKATPPVLGEKSVTWV